MFGEPVTTSVTGKPQRVADAPANIEIITQDDIRRSGATNIPDALAFITGVDVRTYGWPTRMSESAAITSRHNPRLMVLINGRQVYMVDYGRIVWANLPVQWTEIRQIEVIKGPNSALYGFNAVGGVINIITYDPLREKVNAASVRGGTQRLPRARRSAPRQIGDYAGLRLSPAVSRPATSLPGRSTASTGSPAKPRSPAISTPTDGGTSRRRSMRSWKEATARCG